MKKQILILLFLISSLSVFSQEKVTTYYLIRHAEKDRSDNSNKNPNLTEKGNERAKKWANTFKNIAFDAIYSTNYNRTKQTVKPTAESKNIPIKIYNPKKLYGATFQKETKGKTILVVGHSNTTPLFVNKILNNDSYKEIEDNNNANLYIVTIIDGKKSSCLLKIN